ncbi:hypothetical protein XENOCAPTIV_024158, partial [Xenoophorus captivus]
GSENAQRQLYRALRYHTLQDPQLQNTLKDLLASVKASGKGLSTAARLYVTRRLRLKQDFFQMVEQQFGVRPKALLGGAKDMKEVNDWVSQQTGRKVQQFLTKALPRTAGIQMQNEVSMFIFLPDDITTNTTLLEESLTAEFVQDLSMALQPARVSLTLPILTLSYSTDLLPLLSDLGLSEWLDNQELEKISAQAAKLTSLNHKVVMETVPEGIQYPSATSVSSHLTYRVDRPFVYLIRDEPSGALLFIGKVVNPKDLTI